MKIIISDSEKDYNNRNLVVSKNEMIKLIKLLHTWGIGGEIAKIARKHASHTVDGEKCPNCIDGHYYKTIDYCKCGYERRR